MILTQSLVKSKSHKFHGLAFVYSINESLSEPYYLITQQGQWVYCTEFELEVVNLEEQKKDVDKTEAIISLKAAGITIDEILRLNEKGIL